jgi:adenylylsulfate kinase
MEVINQSNYENLGLVVWLTGLSSAGKTTIAKHTEVELVKLGLNTIILDGDYLRNGLNSDLGFTSEDRKENIRRSAEVAKLFYLKGFITLCSFISPCANDRKVVRDLILKERFIEVYIKCSIDECLKRDIKGLYKKALNFEISNFTGISSPYEIPTNPELVIDTEQHSIEQSVSLLVEKCTQLYRNKTLM